MIDKKALQKYTTKHATLCWICDKAGGKCSWSNDFTPIEGWKAIPTKLSVGCSNFIDSFDVYECPEFELLYEIKKGLLNTTEPGRPKGCIQIGDAEKEEIEDLYFNQGMKVEDIAIRFNRQMRTIFRILKIIRESKQNDKKI